MCKKMMLDDVIAVTNRKLAAHPFLEQLERVCLAKPRAVILREKDLTPEEYRLLAKEAMQLCERCGVELILHFYAEAAFELGVKKLHLPLPLLQKMSAPEKERFDVIGCSVHSVEEALAAQSCGASYLTAGHIYATGCKPGLSPRGTGFLREVCMSVEIPVYAIGGIPIEGIRRQEVRDCGAAGACIMSELMRI